MPPDPPLPPPRSLPPLPPPRPDLARVRATLGLEDATRDEPAAEKSVSPGPATNTGGYELRVTATVGAGREVMEMAGTNTSSPAYAFEERVSQGTL